MNKEPETPITPQQSSGLQKTLLALDETFSKHADHISLLNKGENVVLANENAIKEAFRILEHIEKLKKFDDIYNLVFNPKPPASAKGKKTVDLSKEAEVSPEPTGNHMENVLDKVKNRVNKNKDG